MELITLNVPRIGDAWEGQGGVFVAIGRDETGQMYHLIRGPEAPEAMTHEDATKFAAELNIDGLTDFTLPTRRDLSLLKATNPEAFRTDDWYWSSERHPANESYVYAQNFLNGDQHDFSTSHTCYGCAVRRIPI